MALEEAKSGAEDARDEALRQVQHLQHELTHAQSTAAKHEREMLQVRPQKMPVTACIGNQRSPAGSTSDGWAGICLGDASMYLVPLKVKLQHVLQSESAELREALADARKEISHVHAAAAAELAAVRRKDEEASQVARLLRVLQASACNCVHPPRKGRYYASMQHVMVCFLMSEAGTHGVKP